MKLLLNVLRKYFILKLKFKFITHLKQPKVLSNMICESHTHKQHTNTLNVCGHTTTVPRVINIGI